MEEQDHKRNDDQNDQKDPPPPQLPPLTGDFGAWTQHQVIQYFLSLNDPKKPLYAKGELESLEIRQLRAWATKANQIYQAFLLQAKIPPSQPWIRNIFDFRF